VSARRKRWRWCDHVHASRQEAERCAARLGRRHPAVRWSVTAWTRASDHPGGWRYTVIGVTP